MSKMTLCEATDKIKNTCVVIDYRENCIEVSDGYYKASPLCDHFNAYRVYLGGKIVYQGPIHDWNPVHYTIQELRLSDREYLLVSDLHVYRDKIPKIRTNYARSL